MNRCLSALPRTSATAALPAERSTHTQTHTHTRTQGALRRAQHSKSQSCSKHAGPTRTADLTGPLQEAASVPGDSQVCMRVPLICCNRMAASGGVSAGNLRQRRAMKCLGLHAAQRTHAKCLLGRENLHAWQGCVRCQLWQERLRAAFAWLQTLSLPLGSVHMHAHLRIGHYRHGEGGEERRGKCSLQCLRTTGHRLLC